MSAPVSLARLQHQFLDYLQRQPSNEAHELQDQVVEQGSISPAQRLEIYANAYRVRLRKVIETDHPVLCTYLGDEWFARLWQGYLGQHPSQVRSLRYFCRALPAYLRGNKPFSDHPILAEIAAFENILLDSFDAPDQRRVDFSEVQALPAEQWPGMQLRLHPSVQFFSAHWNSVASWQAIKAERPPPAAAQLDAADAQAWLVWRDRDRLTQFRSLTGHEHGLLEAMLAGRDFAWLCASLTGYYPAPRIGQRMVDYLTQWCAEGLLAGINQLSNKDPGRLD